MFPDALQLSGVISDLQLFVPSTLFESLSPPICLPQIPLQMWAESSTPGAGRWRGGKEQTGKVHGGVGWGDNRGTRRTDGRTGEMSISGKL